MNQQKPGFGIADLYLLVTVAIWGATFPVAKYVLGSVPPMVFAACRYMLAALVLMTLMGARQGLNPPRRRDLPALILLGFIGVTLMQLLWTNALALTAASKGAILVAVSPIFAMLFTALRALRKRERGPNAIAWGGVLLSFAGVFLVINNSLTSITFRGGDLVGDLMFLGVAFCWACYSMMAPPYLASMGPLRVTAWSMFFGALILLPFGLIGLDQVSLTAIPPGAWAGFIFTSVGAAALGYLWWYEGVARLGVARSVSYSYLIPVFAMITAAIALGESVSLAQGLGAAIVLAGLIISRLAMAPKT